MSVKIRLKRMGSKKRPFYRIIATDSRMPRDGRFIETLGYYDPKKEPAVVSIKEDLVFKWMERGARPTDNTERILRNAGVMKKWSLLKQGVAPDDLDSKYEQLKASETPPMDRTDQKKKPSAKAEAKAAAEAEAAADAEAAAEAEAAPAVKAEPPAEATPASEAKPAVEAEPATEAEPTAEAKPAAEPPAEAGPVEGAEPSESEPAAAAPEAKPAEPETAEPDAESSAADEEGKKDSDAEGEPEKKS